MKTEIERKFLLKPFNIENLLKKYSIGYEKIPIKQFYLLQSKIRLRKTDKEFTLTKKRGEGLKREEEEKNISKKEFNALLNIYDHLSLTKTRFRCQIGDYTYEIDRFKKELNGLFYLEIEFDSIKNAADYKPEKPFKDLIVAEVTEKPEFSNYYLAKNKTVWAFVPQESTNGSRDIKPTDSTQKAITLLLHKYFRALLYYRGRILNGPYDPEDLHQLRVAARRARSIVKLFKEYFTPKSFELLNSPLKELMEQTGPMRDLEVLHENITKDFKNETEVLKKAQKEIEKILKAGIDQNRKKLKELLSDERFERIKSSILNINKNYFERESKTLVMIAAYRALKPKLKRVKKILASLSKKSDSKRLHRLRIELKTIRYGLEALKASFDQKGTENLLKKIKKMQNLLGRHQDMQIQQLLLIRKLKSDGPSPEALMAAGEILFKMEKERARSKKRFLKKRRKFYSDLKKITPI